MSKKRTSSRQRKTNQTRSEKNQKRNTAPAKKHWLREWIEVISFAVVAALTVHIFIFQPFVVPTPSMAGTVIPGDYLIVSKLHYGPQTPRTLAIPFTGLYWDGIELPNIRIPGFTQVKRGDVVVFHVPTDDKPIDRKQPYLKRAIGLPGDTLSLVDKVVYINGRAWDLPIPEQQVDWIITKKPDTVLPFGKLKVMGIEQVMRTPDPNRFLVREASRALMDDVQALPYIENVRPHTLAESRIQGDTVFPQNQPFNRDQYGPLYIPEAGTTVELTEQNWPAYEEIITRFEGHTARPLKDGWFKIDGTRTRTYTFDQDYYFMMGDNRDNSLDSRFWGYVPADHIAGKAVMTFFSWDKEAARPRLDRLFNLIK